MDGLLVLHSIPIKIRRQLVVICERGILKKWKKNNEHLHFGDFDNDNFYFVEWIWVFELIWKRRFEKESQNIKNIKWNKHFYFFIRHNLCADIQYFAKKKHFQKRERRVFFSQSDNYKIFIFYWNKCIFKILSSSPNQWFQIECFPRLLIVRNLNHISFCNF